MTLRDRITFIPHRLLSDEPGLFLKVLDGGEAGLPPRVGVVYLTTALPGQARGKHYYPACDEWSARVHGKALHVLGDPAIGERYDPADTVPHALWP